MMIPVHESSKQHPNRQHESSHEPHESSNQINTSNESSITPDKNLIENIKKIIAENLLNSSNEFKIKNRKNPEIEDIENNSKILLSPFNTKNVNLKVS